MEAGATASEELLIKLSWRCIADCKGAGPPNCWETARGWVIARVGTITAVIMLAIVKGVV